MLYPDLYETTLKPKNKLEEDLFASKSGSDACVVAYVSKMFAVSAKDLPENKKRSLTAEEMRAKAREARAAKQAEADPATPISNKTHDTDVQQETIEEPKDIDIEVVLGFARLYSGTIKVGSSLYAVLPKYDTAKDPMHPSNAKYLITITVEGLYTMMGRELVPVSQVPAGNIFAIKGLESKVFRSATLCSPQDTGIGENPALELQRDCLVNLGSVNRAVGASALLKILVIDATSGCPNRSRSSGTSNAS